MFDQKSSNPYSVTVYLRWKSKSCFSPV